MQYYGTRIITECNLLSLDILASECQLFIIHNFCNKIIDFSFNNSVKPLSITENVCGPVSNT